MQTIPETIQSCWQVFSSFVAYKWFKATCGFAFGAVTYLFGETQKLAVMLIVLIIMDFLIALITAHRTGKEITSSKAVRTPIKIAVYGIMISAAHLTEIAVKIIPVIDDTAIAFLALTELISIMEHIGELGYAIPKKLLNKLEQLRDDK